MTPENALPPGIRRSLAGWEAVPDTVGRSRAAVCRYTRGGETLFLKAETASAQSRTERDMLLWLSGKVPVPRILAAEEAAGVQYLLLSALPGYMACAPEALRDPVGTARALAEGLRMLWAVPIRDCPSDQRLPKKLAAGRARARRGVVDMDDLDPDHRRFASAAAIVAELAARQPAEEEAVLSHGDYCLPNVFLAGGQVAGFLDLGRAGVASPWQDISLCVRSLRYNFETLRGESAPIDAFFCALGREPDGERIEYYRLLDELF